MSRATPPASTYTPTPRVEPTPSRVRSVVVSTRASELEEEEQSSCFLLVNRDMRELSILGPGDIKELEHLRLISNKEIYE